MAWTYPPLLDDFARADENPLSDGGKWSVQGNPLQVVADVCRMTAQTGPNYGMWTDSQFGGPTVSASGLIASWLTVSGVAAGSFFVEIMSDAVHGNAYACEVTLAYEPLHVPPRTVIANWYIRRRGSDSWVYVVTLGPTVVVNTGWALGIVLRGRTVEAWFYDPPPVDAWTLVDSADDIVESGGAAVLPAGYALIGMNHSDSHYGTLGMLDFHAGGTVVDNAAINNLFGLGE